MPRMSRCHDTLLLLGLWICACHAFSPSVLRPAIGIARGGQGQTGPRPVIAPQGTAQLLVAPRAAPPAMGLFGLGWPEIAVVGTLALLFFGPEKLAPLAKDIGKSASGLKEVSQSFAEGMQEGNANAEMLKKTDGEVVKAETKEVDQDSA